MFRLHCSQIKIALLRSSTLSPCNNSRILSAARHLQTRNRCRPDRYGKFDANVPSLYATFHSSAPQNYASPEHTSQDNDAQEPAEVTRPKRIRRTKKQIQEDLANSLSLNETSNSKGSAKSRVKDTPRSSKRKRSILKTPVEEEGHGELELGDIKGNASSKKRYKRAPHVTVRLGNAATAKKAKSGVHKKLYEPAETGFPEADRIAQEILEGYSGDAGNTQRPKGDTRRVHVVRKELCDDIIERLKPSLESYVGCDILDLNPGPGVFSTAIHDLLKPRTHILMDPDPQLFKPLIQPLLDAPNSTYRLVPKSGIVWGHLESVLTPEFLPHQEAYPSGDPRLEEVNNTLLVVANLGFYPMKPYRGFPSIAKLVLFQLLSAARAHSLFHKYGLVRMLIWIPDVEKHNVVPRSIVSRKKGTVHAEITCSEITEVASSTNLSYMGRRERILDLHGALSVRRKMEEAGIGTPKGRETPIQVEASQLEESQLGDLSGGVQGEKDRVDYSYIPELESLEARFKTGKFQQFKETPEAMETLRPKSLYYTPEYRRLRYLRIRRLVAGRRSTKLDGLLEDYDRIIEEQKEALQLEPNSAEAIKAWAENKQHSEEYREQVRQLGPEIYDQFCVRIDNRRAFLQEPPILQWDGRKVEPLCVEPNEFFPRHELALIDFQPQALWPILRQDFPANYDVLDFILSFFYSSSQQSVRQALLGIYPGALEYIEAECPSLTNPHNGGNKDLDLLGVRCLNQVMLREIVEAWLRWPFRPSRFELMRRYGGHDEFLEELEEADMR